MNLAISSASVLLVLTLVWSYVLLRRLRDWRAGLLIGSLATAIVLLTMAIGSLVTTALHGLPVRATGLAQLAIGCLVVAALIHFNVALRRDALTGLPNRVLFMRRIERALRRVGKGKITGCAILLLNVDRFKIVNESLGHGLGDRLLTIVAKRLLSCVRKGDTVARLGGDEFVVLIPGVDRSSAARAAERLQEALSRPITLNGQEVFTTVSIGIAVTTTSGERAETMLREADLALHRAKMLGKSRHAVFDVSMGESAVARLQLETDLRRATERQELFLHYQPVLSLKDGSVVGLEALLRWRHAHRGSLPPGTFIPLAEETGLIIPIGLWVLEEACRQMRTWQDRFPTLANAVMHVNLSGQQFMQPDLVDQVASVLGRTGLAPECLGLEMTETVMMSDAQQTTSTLAQLRSLNVTLQLDDFGTGYSSLSYLHRFPITTLKIDRSFVMAMHTKEEHAKIVRSINTLARDLQLEVIAEGIERPEQLELLRAWGCKFGQGNFLCAATDRETVESILVDDQVVPGQLLNPAQVLAG